VERVPQFGSDKNILARNAGPLDAFTNFGFVLIN
jgi:hypothetical protein